MVLWKSREEFLTLENKIELKLGEKIITIYASAKADKPVIYLNTFGDDGAWARYGSRASANSCFQAR